MMFKINNKERAWYHGGRYESLNFNDKTTTHSVGTGLWMTDNFDNAVSYISPNNGGLARIVVKKVEKTLTIDFQGKPWSRVPPLPEEFAGCKITDDIVRRARKLGYDSVKFTNVRDMKGRITPQTRNKFSIAEAGKPSTTLVLLYEYQVAKVDWMKPDDIPTKNNSPIREELITEFKSYYIPSKMAGSSKFSERQKVKAAEKREKRFGEKWEVSQAANVKHEKEVADILKSKYVGKNINPFGKIEDIYYDSNYGTMVKTSEGSVDLFSAKSRILSDYRKIKDLHNSANMNNKGYYRSYRRTFQGQEPLKVGRRREDRYINEDYFDY